MEDTPSVSLRNSRRERETWKDAEVIAFRCRFGEQTPVDELRNYPLPSSIPRECLTLYRRGDMLRGLPR